MIGLACYWIETFWYICGVEMTLKQNTDFKKRFDEYIEKNSRKTEKNKIKTFMKQIRHGLARGADKKNDI